MILLIYRIQANIPVIIIGETGCGKTLLVIKLSQILNNGENKVRIINIHPDITEEDICKEMKRINEEAKCIKD
jgi:MoxR-like ATPase